MLIFLSDYITVIRSRLDPKTNALVSDEDLCGCYDSGEEVDDAVNNINMYFNLTRVAQ